MVKRIGIGAGYDQKEEDHWTFKVKQDLHFKNFYRSFHEYFQDNDFVSLFGDGIFETFYDEKHFPDGEREYRLRWRVFYKTDNTQVILKHSYDWQILRCKDKSVVVDGKKLTVQNLEVEIKSKSYVLVNKKEMRSKKFLAPFAKLFFDRWFRYLYEGYKADVKKQSKDIEEQIKALFSVTRYTDTGFEFNRAKGYENPNKANN